MSATGKRDACNVAMCDVSPIGLAETQRLCEAAGLPQGLRVTTHIADVADRTQVERFRDEIADRHRGELQPRVYDRMAYA